MNRSDAEREHIVSVICRIIVQHPDATNKEVQRILEGNKIRGLTENTVGKYVRKARARIVMLFDRQTVKYFKGECLLGIRLGLAGLWSMANDTNLAPSIRVGVYNSIERYIRLHAELFFPAGAETDKDGGKESKDVKEMAAELERVKAEMPQEFSDQWQKNDGRKALPPPIEQPQSEEKQGNP